MECILWLPSVSFEAVGYSVVCAVGVASFRCVTNFGRNPSSLLLHVVCAEVLFGLVGLSTGGVCALFARDII